MRILEWAFPYAPIRGGRANLISRMARKFQENNLEVFLIGGNEEGLEEAIQELTNQEVINQGRVLENLLVALPNEPGFHSTAHNDLLQNKLQGAVEKFNPEIIHFHNASHISTYYLLETVRKLNRKPILILSLHDLESVCALGAPDTHVKELIDATDLFICPSEYMRNELLENTAILPGKIKLILSGAPKNPVKPNPQARKSQECLLVANLAPHKGAALVLSAWVMLQKKYPEARLRIIGDGVHFNFLTSFITALGLNDTVTIEEWKNYSELMKIYETAGLLYAPSTIPEAFGLSVVEAQLSGVPVIASNIGAHRETIKDGITGILIPPGDIFAIVEATKLMFESGIQRKYSAFARMNAEHNFDFDRTIAEHLVLFAAAIS